MVPSKTARKMTARYASTCGACKGQLQRGDTILWDGGLRRAFHPVCPSADPVGEAEVVERLIAHLAQRQAEIIADLRSTTRRPNGYYDRLNDLLDTVRAELGKARRDLVSLRGQVPPPPPPPTTPRKRNIIGTDPELAAQYWAAAAVLPEDLAVDFEGLDASPATAKAARDLAPVVAPASLATCTACYGQPVAGGCVWCAAVAAGDVDPDDVPVVARKAAKATAVPTRQPRPDDDKGNSLPAGRMVDATTAAGLRAMAQAAQAGGWCHVCGSDAHAGACQPRLPREAGNGGRLGRRRVAPGKDVDTLVVAGTPEIAA